MFGDALKKMMVKKKVGVSKFNKLTGISAGYMSDLQKNRYLPSPEKLDIIIKTLELNEEEAKELKEKWTFSKTGNVLAPDYEKLKESNKNMKIVLQNVKKETDLLKELEIMEDYKKIYDTIFGNLSTEESKELLKAISEKLEIFALRKGKYEQVKEKLDKLNKIIKEIE